MGCRAVINTISNTKKQIAVEENNKMRRRPGERGKNGVLNSTEERREGSRAVRGARTGATHLFVQGNPALKTNSIQVVHLVSPCLRIASINWLIDWLSRKPHPWIHFLVLIHIISHFLPFLLAFSFIIPWNHWLRYFTPKSSRKKRQIKHRRLLFSS